MLFEKIKNALKEAMLAKDPERVSVFRFLLSALNNKAIELQKELTDEDVLQVITKQAKERRESIVAFAGKRDDLADKERRELEILSSFLPQQLSEEDVDKIVMEVIDQVKASGLGDFGKVMGQVMARVKGQADGNMVSELVKKRLSA